MQRLQIALAQIKALFCQHHDAAAFRRFVGQRRQLGGIGKGFLFHALRRQECRSLAVAEGNGAGFVQQQDVDVARRLNRAAAGGDDVRAEHAAHPGNADGRQQAPNSGGDQAYQQRHQYRYADRITAPGGEGPDSGGGQQEYQRQGNKQDG